MLYATKVPPQPTSIVKVFKLCIRATRVSHLMQFNLPSFKFLFTISFWKKKKKKKKKKTFIFKRCTLILSECKRRLTFGAMYTVLQNDLILNKVATMCSCWNNNLTSQVHIFPVGEGKLRAASLRVYDYASLRVCETASLRVVRLYSVSHVHDMAQRPWKLGQ